MATAELSRQDSRSRTGLASHDVPAMEGPGKEYLAPAVLWLINTDPRIQRAILDLVMRFQNIQTEI